MLSFSEILFGSINGVWSNGSMFVKLKQNGEFFSNVPTLCTGNWRIDSDSIYLENKLGPIIGKTLNDTTIYLT